MTKFGIHCIGNNLKRLKLQWKKKKQLNTVILFLNGSRREKTLLENRKFKWISNNELALDIQKNVNRT